MKEREISLIDLFVDILLHWRVFIVCMLIGAVLLGAFSYYHSSNVIKNQKIQEERRKQKPEDWLSKEEIQNVNYLRAYEKAYSEKAIYLEKAMLMKLDPNAVSRADATIVIEGTDYQQSCDIKKVYEDIVQSGELITRIVEDTGMETTGIDEMIFIDKNLLSKGVAADSGNDNVDVNVDVNADTNAFRIVTIHSEEAQCKAMLDAIIAFLKEKHSVVEGTFGEHEIIVVNEAYGVVSDTNIANKQQMVLYNMTSMKRIISDAKDDLSATEKQYYDLAVNEEEPLNIQIGTPHISLKYVILGAAVAAFLYAAMLFIIYISNLRIRKTDNFQDLFDVPQLGMIPMERSRKKFLDFIDKWLLSIQNRNKRQFTQEEAFELTCVAAKMSAGKETLQEICLVGCGLKERSLEVCKRMQAWLKEEKIQVSILNNVLYDARMMEELEDAKGVIVVESVGTTLYAEITEELEIMRRLGIKVLGGILVE